MRRHPGLTTLTSLLERILIGRGADDALLTLPRTGMVRLSVLPAWGWTQPLVSMGRKQIDRANGTDHLMPVRLSWGGPHVIATPTDQAAVTLDWMAAGAGVRESGICTIVDTPPVVAVDGQPLPDQTVGSETISATSARSRLTTLSAEGKHAYWEALAFLDSNLVRPLDSAAWIVASEIGVGGAATEPVLDSESLVQARTEMVYGCDDTQTPATRLLERCMGPETFAKVDPERYVLTTLRRDAAEFVRRKIGLPHIGRKVLTVIADMGIDLRAGVRLSREDLGRIVDEYATRYPADKVKERRIISTLLAVQRGAHVAQAHNERPEYEEAMAG